MKITVVMEDWEDENRTWMWRLIGKLARYHVWAIIDYIPEDNAALVVDPASTGLRIHPAEKIKIRESLQNHDIVDTVTLEIKEPPSVQFHWFEWLSCVTIIKRLIGLNAWWVQTPRQLMKALHEWQK